MQVVGEHSVSGEAQGSPEVEQTEKQNVGISNDKDG